MKLALFQFVLNGDTEYYFFIKNCSREFCFCVLLCADRKFNTLNPPRENQVTRILSNIYIYNKK